MPQDVSQAAAPNRPHQQNRPELNRPEPNRLARRREEGLLRRSAKIKTSLERGMAGVTEMHDATLRLLTKLNSRAGTTRSTAEAVDLADPPTSRIKAISSGAAPDTGADLYSLSRARETLRLLRAWPNTGRAEQMAPQGDWRVWLLMGGRGSGKTRAGAEWVQELAGGRTARPGLRIALLAETLGDAREVMIDGVSGICRIARENRPDFETSRRRLVWPNGTVAQIFSSEDPESLRGPQFDYAWCDELGKWKHGQETWDMLQFALRLGERPQALVTTTPRPVPVLKALIVARRHLLDRSALAFRQRNALHWQTLTFLLTRRWWV